MGIIKNKESRTRMNMKQKCFAEKINSRFLVLGCLVSFLLTFTLSVYMDTTAAPDEETRYLLPLWIYNNNSLPYGNEPLGLETIGREVNAHFILNS